MQTLEIRNKECNEARSYLPPLKTHSLPATAKKMFHHAACEEDGQKGREQEGSEKGARESGWAQADTCTNAASDANSKSSVEQAKSVEEDVLRQPDDDDYDDGWNDGENEERGGEGG